MRKSFRLTGGSEAVDIALQAAMAHTGRRTFVSIADSSGARKRPDATRRLGFGWPAPLSR